MAEYLSAVILSLVSSIIYFGFNGLVIWGVIRLMRFRRQGLRSAFLLSGIAAGVSFPMSLIPTFMGTIDLSVWLNVGMFLVNTGVFLYAAHWVFDESVARLAGLWGFVFIADFVFGIIVSLILGLVMSALGVVIPGIV